MNPTWRVKTALVIGVGIAAAPLIFQMFTRAPLGGEMINEFRPFMTGRTISTFGSHLDKIDAAAGELASGDISSERYPSISRFVTEWPTIESDMRGMLGVMQGDLDNFEAVDALPPFELFPWFFVFPGLAVAAVAGNAWLKRSERRRHLVGLGIVGAGLIAAPFLFQMFSRAPQGAVMINDFRPLMTRSNVTKTQLYFLTIGAAEGEFRTQFAKPQEIDKGSTARDLRSAFPASTALSEQFPKISGDMAPMIGAMSDNLDNYAAVDALPPFDLFPWFFVGPGLILLTIASKGGSSRKSARARLAAALLLLGACGTDAPKPAASPVELTGLFELAPGRCTDAGITEGSYFRMVNPGGKTDSGRFVTNGDSPCGDKTWSPLAPGSDGGLNTKAFQPNPDPPFDPTGHALAGRIALPTRWFAVSFALSTNATDPQTNQQTALPKIFVKNGKLSGDLRAVAAAWNRQHFNQGSPKPDGSKPGATSDPTGTYDAKTNRYELEWTSQIVGGPFNNFIGVWHLEGRFASG